jgi:hypothetical protein
MQEHRDYSWIEIDTFYSTEVMIQIELKGQGLVIRRDRLKPWVDLYSWHPPVNGPNSTAT